MAEILLVLIIGACLFDALVSWRSALGIGYMRHMVPHLEQRNRNKEAHHREIWE